MNFKEYKQVDYAQIAQEIADFWQKESIFEKSISSREGKPSYTFYEGPPSANGTPGIHHVMARTIKDIFCRYQTLKGKQVNRKGGWDTHGLPVELQVEKELGITKEDIGKKITVEEYNQKCRETVMRFTDQWEQMTKQMGYWVDMEQPYVTYENNYIESVWYLLKELYNKGLLYKGYTIQPYSPAAGTGLSSHELNMPGTYQDVKDTSIVAQFKVIKNQKSAFLFQSENWENSYILAWTTTPWTLPSNSALTVGKNIEYAIVKTFNPYTFLPVNVVLAKDLVVKHFNDNGKDGDFENYKGGDKIIPWTITTTIKGAELEGIEYEQLMPYVSPPAPDGEANKGAFRVIIGDFVTTEDGTGVVHTAPTFGADDFRVAAQNNVPAIMVKDADGKDVPLVDKQGKFVKQVKDFAREYVKEAYLTDEEKESERKKQKRDKYLSVDERIAIKLKTENKAFTVQRYEHTYPHCWRTDKPILYYPLDSWFIRTTAVKDKMIALNQTINWKPESTGTGRFGNWLENLVDWNLSRSRYWGTPLPIWRSEDGSEEICIGSVKELENEINSAIATGLLNEVQKTKNEKFIQGLLAAQNTESAAEGSFDLHRPFVDEIYLVSALGKVMTRETDLIDVWFDSGAMPYAQWHYPFENQDVFQKSYPANFISEGVDQTRGWFFTLHAISAMVSDSVAFKNVVSTGLVLDKNGNKMSKRLGNAIDPFDTLAKYGADPTRWYMISNAQPWDNLKFDLDGITEVRNKFFGTLTNTYNFFALYANLDNYSIEEHNRVPYQNLAELDRWIISKLISLVREVDAAYTDYEPTKAARAIQDFVSDHLSNWYVRLSRRRFWMGQMTEDKKGAYETLQHCLAAVAQLMAPIAPFYGDWLYKNLTSHIRAAAKEKNTPFAADSVHLSDFHTDIPEWIDTNLEESMDLAQRICSLVHSIRKANRIKVRQPLGKVLIPVLNPKIRQQIASVEELIKTEVNIKTIAYLDDTSGVLNKKVKPNFKALGPKFGKEMKVVADAILELQNNQLELLEEGKTILLATGHEITLAEVEILSEDLPGYLSAKDAELLVALDITITTQLRYEGIAREFVNRIQNYRKDNGFDVTDKINIAVLANGTESQLAIENFKDYIAQEVQATAINFVENLTNAIDFDLDGQIIQATITINSIK
jgi:isoleucyl-tRNA synthetase